MSKYEERFTDNLSKDDEAFLANLEDNKGLFQQYFSTFQGPLKFWTYLITVLTLIASGIGLYAAWKFATGADIRGILMWAGIAWAAWTVQIAMKQWVFERMNHLAVLRELKKIELRLAHLEDSRH